VVKIPAKTTSRTIPAAEKTPATNGLFSKKGVGPRADAWERDAVDVAVTLAAGPGIVVTIVISPPPVTVEIEVKVTEAASGIGVVTTI